MSQKFSPGVPSPLPVAKSRKDSGVDMSVPKTDSKANIAGSGKDAFPPSKYEPSSAAKSAPSFKSMDMVERHGDPRFGQS